MLVTLKVFGLFSFLTNKEIKGKKMKLKKKKLFFLFHVKGGSGIEDSSGNRTNRMGREKRQKKGGVVCLKWRHCLMLTRSLSLWLQLLLLLDNNNDNRTTFFQK